MSATLFACNNGENLLPFDANEPIVVDGRLDFSTQEAFTKYINSIQNMRDEDLDVKLSNFHEFASLRPLFDETHTDKILVWAAAKKERIEKEKRRVISASGRGNLPSLPCDMLRMSNALDDIDSEDELIKDPSFAALLNREREISVAGKAYKYTYEGTYITDKDNLSAVYNYIEKTDYSEIAQLPSGTNNIGNGVSLFRIAPIDDCGGGGSTGGGSTGGYNGDPSYGIKKAQKSFMP